MKSQMYLPDQNRVECHLLFLDLYGQQFTVLAVNTYSYHIAIQNQTENELMLHLTPCFDLSEPEQQFLIHVADLLWYSFHEINIPEHWLKG